VVMLVHGHGTSGVSSCYFKMLLSCQSHECSYFTPVSISDLCIVTRDRGDHVTMVHGLSAVT